jgi:hypothetical protein
MLEEDGEDVVAFLEHVGGHLDLVARLALDGIAPTVHGGGDVLDHDGAAQVLGGQHGVSGRGSYRQCSTR